MDKGIKIKISGEQLAALYHLYEGLWANYTADNEYEMLLLAHIYELKDKLEKMTERNNKSFSLKIEGSELVAFVQLWANGSGGPKHPYVAQVLQMVFNELDRVSKNARVHLPPGIRYRRNF